MRVVVALAGRKGSGKSTIARTLEEQHGFAVASFGRFVRAEAAVQKLPLETSTLEEVGRVLIRDKGWLRFCTEVIQHAQGAPMLVVDGLRHWDAVVTIRQLTSPSRFALVFVEVDEAERLARLARRLRNSSDDAAPDHDGMIDDLETLRKQANLIVLGKGSEAVGQILEWIGADDHLGH